MAAVLAGVLSTAGPFGTAGAAGHRGTRAVAASYAGAVSPARQIQFSATSAVLAPSVAPAPPRLIGHPELDAFGVKAAGGHGALTPRQIARRMLRQFHWRAWQFRYLNLLWTHESGWNVYASNGYTGAYGIPQATPGAKMASAGPRWWASARTQIRWGLRYIKEVYGSPWAAWEHELATGWY